MFIITSRYLKPLSEVDRHLTDHRLFLDKYYAENTFFCSGGQNPRTGGVILARATTREQLESILKEDPFSIHGVAKYEIMEFTPTKFNDEFKRFLD